MDKIRGLSLQSIIIAVCIFINLSIQMAVGHYVNGTQVYEIRWYLPVSILVTAVLCSLPSLLLSGDRELIVRDYLLHYGSIGLIVMISGALYGWYGTVFEASMMAITYTIIYGAVWLMMAWLTKREEKAINQALREIQDEDE